MLACGQCRYFQQIEADTPEAMGLCFGVPPQVIMCAPTKQPDGTLMPDLQSFRPLVRASDRACSYWGRVNQEGNA